MFVRTLVVVRVLVSLFLSVSCRCICQCCCADQSAHMCLCVGVWLFVCVCVVDARNLCACAWVSLCVCMREYKRGKKEWHFAHVYVGAKSESECECEWVLCAKERLKFEGALGRFSPEFCMGGKYTKGDASNLLCVRICFVYIYIYEGWCLECIVCKDLLCRIIHTFILMCKESWSNMWLMPKQNSN